jgi:hypothetical protein
MSDVRYTSGKGTQEKRIADRLKSSGAGAHPDTMVKHGDGPTRAITHIHHGGYQANSRKNAGGEPPKGAV